MLIGNKCDLEDERNIPYEDGQLLAEKLGCQFMEASAKSRTNVEESFYNLVREIRKHSKGTKKEVTGNNNTAAASTKTPPKKTLCLLL